MEVFFLPKEAVLLEFKCVNGSGWLTNYRFILCEHEPGHLEGHTSEFYFLKDFEKAQIKGSILTTHFRDKPEVKILLPVNSLTLLQEVKNYIEKAAKNIT